VSRAGGRQGPGRTGRARSRPPRRRPFSSGQSCGSSIRHRGSLRRPHQDRVGLRRRRLGKCASGRVDTARRRERRRAPVGRLARRVLRALHPSLSRERCRESRAQGWGDETLRVQALVVGSLSQRFPKRRAVRCDASRRPSKGPEGSGASMDSPLGDGRPSRGPGVSGLPLRRGACRGGPWEVLIGTSRHSGEATDCGSRRAVRWSGRG
jgi:hypothetical protein